MQYKCKITKCDNRPQRVDGYCEECGEYRDRVREKLQQQEGEYVNFKNN